MSQVYEAVYENGVIRLLDDVRLPENTKVYVVVPVSRIVSPHLVHPQQIKDFEKEVSDNDNLVEV